MTLGTLGTRINVGTEGSVAEGLVGEGSGPPVCFLR